MVVTKEDSHSKPSKEMQPTVYILTHAGKSGSNCPRVF